MDANDQKFHRLVQLGLSVGLGIRNRDHNVEKESLWIN